MTGSHPKLCPVNAKDISWFHCGRCGSLFKSTAGEMDDRLWSNCGSKPSLGLETPVFEPESQEGGTADPSEPAATGERARLPVRKRRRSYLMAKLLGGWALLLVGIVLAARWYWGEDTENRPVAPATPVAEVSAADLELRKLALDPCVKTFSDFLNAITPEESNQFVLDPVRTAARMDRFYALNPLAKIDPATLTLRDSAVVHIPSKRAIEMYWNLNDGRTLDAVFVEQDNEWRLDWDHYVRASDYPWALFLAGSGEPEGEFRLLARERLADERKGSDTISMVLYAPRFGHANETGSQSPEFLVKRDSVNGMLLTKAFKMEREGTRVFGVALPSINPEGLVRLRVRVRRIEENRDRRFELVNVVACHWYSSDDPGVEISDQLVPK